MSYPIVAILQQNMFNLIHRLRSDSSCLALGNLIGKMVLLKSIQQIVLNSENGHIDFFFFKMTPIMKTCPCNVYPLEPHFYIAKLGYAVVYLFFLFLLQNIDCGYPLEPLRRGGSNVYTQSMF